MSFQASIVQIQTVSTYISIYLLSKYHLYRLLLYLFLPLQPLASNFYADGLLSENIVVTLYVYVNVYQSIFHYIRKLFLKALSTSKKI